MLRWSYRYVGPAELKTLVRPGGEGRSMRSAADFSEWVSARTAEELTEPFTFVVDATGVLRLAPRRSEHVVCAGGEAVLSAGEMSFRKESGRWAVDEVSNQSTGYCPDTSSWPAIADALDRAGIVHPGRFTHEVVFRRCPCCQQVNVVREEAFVCALCDEALPQEWNVDAEAAAALVPRARSLKDAQSTTESGPDSPSAHASLTQTTGERSSTPTNRSSRGAALQVRDGVTAKFHVGRQGLEP